MDILKEAKHLYDMGWATHWIKPNSKAPVKADWTNPVRDDWDTVKKEYHQGYGLGVRLGESSKIGDGYLANIDVDIKSSDVRHREEALSFLESKFPALINSAPIVKTGYGLRLFVKTKTPMKSGKLGASPEECIVYMPMADKSKQQRAAVEKGKLTQKQLDEGYRIRPAWEVEFMSTGRQVVLPPSIHPETKRPYIWERSVNAGIPPIQVNGNLGPSSVLGKKPAAPFSAVEVDLRAKGLSPRIIDMIESGTNVEDRSAALLGVTIAMVRQRLTDDEILSVLTNRDHFLGEVAYEHRHTDSQGAAASWIRDYTLRKAREECNAAKAFESEVEVTPLLDDKAAAQQAKELAETWQESGKKVAKIGKTLKNTLRILEKTYGPNLFKRDLFSGYNLFNKKVPWGGEVDDEFTDLHRPLLLEWFAKEWNVEPSVNMLFDAVSILASRNSFHPIKDYLLSLTWDGVPRASTWLKEYMKAHDVSELYLREVSEAFLVGMVSRIMEPGCQLDYMLILKGDQGIKKSSALSVLAGAKYFTSTVLQAGEKDSILKMRNKWLIEFGELSTLKRDVQALKNFITTRVDRDRMPFDHFAQDFPRKCVFAGSTNQEEVFSDTTGNRRFWVVPVGEVDLEGIKKVRDQLFAEAMEVYKLGGLPCLSREAEAEARNEQARWMPTDTIVESVEQVLEQNYKKSNDDGAKFPPNGFSLFQLMEKTHFKDDMQTQRRVGHALRELGYIKRNAKINGKSVKSWFKS